MENKTTEIEIITGAAIPTRSLEHNPAAVYLATLRPTGRRSMHQVLDVMAALLSNNRVTSALEFPWQSLGYQHTAALRASLQEMYKPATVNKALSALRGVLKQAWQLGLLDSENYQRAVNIKGVRGESLPRGRALDKEELKFLLKACAGDKTPIGARDGALIGVLYSAGLRRSEIVALDLADFGPRTASLKIRNAKGGKERLCYLAEFALNLLQKWLEVRGEKAGPLFYPLARDGKVQFRRMVDQTVFDILIKRGKEGGMESFSPHDLRRTFISDLLDAGADISTVQRLAGHASVNTTTRYDRRGEAPKKKATNLLQVELEE